jgi:DNA-binding transcriptional MerR regulator
MPAEYTLTDLAKLAGVSTRTVRYYIAQGLLPSPTQAGSNSRYSDEHLERLRKIRRLQAAHLPLAEIRRLLEQLSTEEVAALSDATTTRDDLASDTALDYIESLLRPRTVERPASIEAPVFARRTLPAADLGAQPLPGAPLPLPSAPVPAAPPPASNKPSTEPDRAQWERITLDPDLELHVRRPLTRQLSKQVERLIAIARELLKEE